MRRREWAQAIATGTTIARQVEHPIGRRQKKKEGRNLNRRQNSTRRELTETVGSSWTIGFWFRNKHVLLNKGESNNIEGIENRKVCIFNREPFAKSSFVLDLSDGHVSGAFLLTKIKKKCGSGAILSFTFQGKFYVEIHLFTNFEPIESIKLNNMNDDV